MKRTSAIAVSAIFAISAPGTVAGIVPWWISRWKMQAPFLHFYGFRVIGILFILASLPVLLDSFARFALQGLGTPAPAFPTRHLVVTGLYRYVRNRAGGPFDYEAMVSTSGPGMALLFILIVPWLFSVPMALASAEMATAMPVEGGFYRWTRAAFGDFWGFQCGWWNWTGTFFMWASYGVVLADYVAQVTPVHSRLVHWAIAVIFLVLVAGLNILGIRVVGKLTLVLLLLQMLPVAAFVYLGFTHAHFNPFHPWMPPGRPWREVYGVGLALALWIYSGYEQLSTVIEEVEEPARNFPRGLAIVVPLAAVIYFLPMAAGLAALGNWQEWQTAYLVTAGRMLGGSSMGLAMFAGAALCAFVLLDATVLSVSRVPFTMAEDGYLHSALARLHPRFGTPVLAIVISTLFCSMLALGSVTQLIAIYAWMRSLHRS